MTVVLHLIGVFIVGLAVGLFASKFVKQEDEGRLPALPENTLP